MADVSKLRELDADRLAKVQAVIDLFHLLGCTDEEISLLPQVLKNWGKVIDVINKHSGDLEILKKKNAGQGNGNADTESDTSDNLRSLVGFDSSPERVIFKGDKGGNV